VQHDATRGGELGSRQSFLAAGLPVGSFFDVFLQVADAYGPSDTVRATIEVVKADPTITVFGGTYAGVFFFVPATQHECCRDLLRSQGFADTIASEASMEKIDGA